MENISLKSLVSRKTINDAELDEGILDTGWDAIKRAGAAIKRQYDISKANGDEAAAMRAKKKYDDWKAKVESDVKKDAGKTPPPLPVDGRPTSADDINPELLGDPKTAYDVHGAESDAQLAAKTRTPVTDKSPSIGGEKSTTDRSIKSPMDVSIAKKIGSAVVKKRTFYYENTILIFKKKINLFLHAMYTNQTNKINGAFKDGYSKKATVQRKHPKSLYQIRRAVSANERGKEKILLPITKPEKYRFQEKDAVALKNIHAISNSLREFCTRLQNYKKITQSLPP